MELERAGHPGPPRGGAGPAWGRQRALKPPLTGPPSLPRLLPLSLGSPPLPHLIDFWIYKVC